MKATVSNLMLYDRVSSSHYSILIKVTTIITKTKPQVKKFKTLKLLLRLVEAWSRLQTGDNECDLNNTYFTNHLRKQVSNYYII